MQPGTVVVEVSHGALPFEMPLRLAVETESGVFVQELALTDSALPQSFVVTLDRPLRSLRVLPTPIYLKTFESALAGDIDLNGEVDGADLVELAIHYRRALTVTHQNQRIVTPDADWLFTADCNGDTVVDEKDLAVLRAAYGQRNE